MGSSFEGQVTERARKDGRADVHVVFHARNVLAWAIDTSNGNAIVFGHTGAQVSGGADAALADVLLTMDFINTAPGAPIPSLYALSFIPSPNYTLNKMSVVANASGTFRAAYGVADGTPGKMRTTQRGLFDVKGIDKTHPDQYPAEKVTFIVNGQ